MDATDTNDPQKPDKFNSIKVYTQTNFESTPEFKFLKASDALMRKGVIYDIKVNGEKCEPNLNIISEAQIKTIEELVVPEPRPKPSFQYKNEDIEIKSRLLSSMSNRAQHGHEVNLINLVPPSDENSLAKI